jgi:hypothetical protein
MGVPPFACGVLGCFLGGRARPRRALGAARQSPRSVLVGELSYPFPAVDACRAQDAWALERWPSECAPRTPLPLGRSPVRPSLVGLASPDSGISRAMPTTVVGFVGHFIDIAPILLHTGESLCLVLVISDNA